MSERCIFAEHFNADNIAKGEAGYQAKCDELRGFVFEPLRAYIAGEYERAGVNPDDVAKFLGVSPTMVRQHYLSRSQWAFPTEASYEKQRLALSQLNHNGQYLRREYEDLRREYEDLRREYEDLRREYEDLRRPFSVTADVPYTDVWTFPTVQAYKGKHPCEKPLAMMEHIIKASSREGATVMDCFLGGGTTAIAAAKLGRKFIGMELDETYFRRAVARLERETQTSGIFAEVA
jgi:site-specific DNA-methyltransferase (adenine-specific)